MDNPLALEEGRASPYVHLRQPKTLYLNRNLTLAPQTLALFPNPDQYVMGVTLLEAHTIMCSIR